MSSDNSVGFATGEETGLETYVPPKILLLDEDPSFLNRISEGVRKSIFTLQTALDVNAGLLYACNEPYDAILVNYKMFPTIEERYKFLEDVRSLPGCKNTPVSLILPDSVDAESEAKLKNQFASTLVRDSDIKEISRHLLSLISGSFDRYSVLIVSQTAETCLSLTERLTQANLSVCSTQASAETIELVYREKPDLLLFDYGMGDDECSSICRQIRSFTRLRHYPVALFADNMSPRTEISDAVFIINTKDPDSKLISILKNRASEFRDRFRNLSRDELTSLPLRNKLFQYLIPRVHFKHSDNRLQAVACDIASLGKINKKYGYEAGDEVLRRLSTYLQQTFSGLQVYNWGSDDFIIVGDASDPKFAKLETAQERFGRLKFDGVDESVRLRIGTAIFPDDSNTAARLVSVALARLSKEQFSAESDRD